MPLLGACGGDQTMAPQADLAETTSPADTPAAAPQADVAAADCPGYDQLSDEQLAARRRLQYADRSPEPDRHA